MGTRLIWGFYCRGLLENGFGVQYTIIIALEGEDHGNYSDFEVILHKLTWKPTELPFPKGP